MSKITKNDFIKGLKQSGIVELIQLEDLLNKNPVETPEAVAQLLIREELLTTWQAKFLMTGRTRLDVGSYRLLERIQRDELGDRLLAIHTSLARKVDIQILPAALTKDQKNCDRFIQKASLAAQLDHPHLTHIFDIDQEGGRYFLVTEHIEGQTLDQSTSIQFDELLIAKIIQQAIDGLQHAHQMKVIHGWIGKQDLILDAQQNLKIQNLPLSPLRRQLSGTQEQSTVAQDFSALATIGQSLLKESKLEETSLGEELSGLLTQLRDASPESTQDISASLLLFIQMNAVPKPMDFGGFDHPVASTSLSPRKKKKVSPETEAPPAPQKLTGLSRLWRDNPVAVIATSIVVAIFLIAGSVFGTISLLNFSKSTTTVTANLDGPLLPNVTPPKTSAPEGTSQPDGTPPTDQEMQEFLDNLGNNKSKNPRPPGGKKAPRVKPVREVENQTPPPKTKPPAKPTPPAAVKPQPKTDLTIIKGIAEKTQEVLNKGDVKTIDQMAKMSPTEIKLALQKGGWNPANKIEDYRSWIEQAKKLTGDTSPVKQAPPSVAATKPGQPEAAKVPFANFPERFTLPPIENTKEKKLADLIIKRQYLLALEIICEEGVARSKPVFELERSKDDKQKWNVTVRKSAKQRALPIATFRKSENAILFQWLDEASSDKTAAKLASNLRNCLLKLKLPEDQGTIVFLRSPLKIPDLRLNKESFSNELELLIPAMPAPETIVVEVLPLRIKGVESTIPNSRVEKNVPAKIWLKRSDKTGFMWIQVAGDLRSKLILKSNLVMNANGEIKPIQSPKMLENLAVTSEGMKRQSQAMLQAFSRSNQGPQFAAQRNNLATQHQKHIQTNEKLNDYIATIPKVIEQPITVRIYAKLGNYQVPLAVTDPKLPQPKK